VLTSQRIDKWLWHARVVRTRTAAAGLANGGHVRVNGARIAAASTPIRVGDVVTVALTGGVRVLKVEAFASRRGPSQEAKRLYVELREARPKEDRATVEVCLLADKSPLR
jgi:ribosome-associated heat shock protein Hsp15